MKQKVEYGTQCLTLIKWMGEGGKSTIIFEFLKNP
jgi:hypothetical protein